MGFVSKYLDLWYIPISIITFLELVNKNTYFLRINFNIIFNKIMVCLFNINHKFYESYEMNQNHTMLSEYMTQFEDLDNMVDEILKEFS